MDPKSAYSAHNEKQLSDIRPKISKLMDFWVQVLNTPKFDIGLENKVKLVVQKFLSMPAVKSFHLWEA